MSVGVLSFPRRTRCTFPVPIPQDSNVELTWRVFGGEIADILLLALKQRCYNDGLDTDRETLITQFRLHLHRGIGYLAGDQNIKKIEDLMETSHKESKILILQSIANIAR